MEEFDSKLKIKLFPHQIESIKNMESLEDSKKAEKKGVNCDTSMGILGDIPGYGKSLSVVSLIARDKMNFGEGGHIIRVNYLSGQYSLYNFYYTSESYKKVSENLVVASTSIISQWEEYFKLSDLKVTVITTKKHTEKFSFGNQDVVLVSSKVYNLFCMAVKESKGKVCWKRFVYDEPGITHIPGMKESIAGFYWFVTASYVELPALIKRGNSNFITNTFKYLDRNSLEMLVIKNEDKFVKESFKMPETIFKYHKCANNKLLKIIKNHVSQAVNIMIQAGNIKGALEVLGNSKKGNLLEVLTEKKREQLERAELNINFYKDKIEHKAEYIKWEEKAQKLRESIEELDKKISDLEDDCCICYNQIENPVLLSNCNHMFCGKCILEWYKTSNKCPLCRDVGSLDKLVYITDEKYDKTDKKDSPKPKHKLVIDIIKNRLSENKNSKFIIFSDYDESFQQLKTECDENKIEWIELTGTAATKNRKLHSYRNGNIPLIFLNSRVNSGGINLQETTDIILYHDMDYPIQEQIIGRANRIGRKDDLYVHKFNYHQN